MLAELPAPPIPGYILFLGGGGWGGLHTTAVKGCWSIPSSLPFHRTPWS